MTDGPTIMKLNYLFFSLPVNCRRVETSSIAPVQNSYTTRPKVVQPPRNTYYNTTNANPQYDPNQFDAYYSVYDEDADLYRDVGEYWPGLEPNGGSAGRTVLVTNKCISSVATDYGQQYNPNSQRPEVQSTYRPVTTTTTTTTTPAPHREVYVSQKPAYKPVTYDYEDSLGGQVSTPIVKEREGALIDRHVFC